MTLLSLSCDTMEAYITLECNLNFDVSELNELDWIPRIVNEDPEYYQLLNLLGSTVVLYDPDLLIHPVKLFFHDRSWYYAKSFVKYINSKFTPEVVAYTEHQFNKLCNYAPNDEEL